MNDDTIVLDCHLGRGNDFVSIKFGTGEIDIVGLPCQWWQTHVQLGLRIAVDPAAFVVSPFKAE